MTLTTLGFGDLTPTAEWLRIGTPLEALLGFGLLSASVSWLLLVYPVLSRRRSLAYEVSLLRREEEETGSNVIDLEPDAAERAGDEAVAERVRLRAKLLAEALGDLAATSRRFHGGEGEAAADLLEAFARDHMR